MKKYVSVILIILTMGALAGYAGQTALAHRDSSPEQSDPGSTTDSSLIASESEELPDDSFSEEDYQKLSALQADDYRHMKISEFRSYIAKLADTEEYLDLLERFWSSQSLYEKRNTDETAAFLFYVLPLAGEEGNVRTYNGETISSYPADPARLEYSFTLTILRPDRIMVKDYNDTRSNVNEMMQDVLRNKTKEELRNEAAMRTELQAYIEEMLSYLQTPELQVTLEFKYSSLAMATEEQQASEKSNSKETERRTSIGTEEDYRSLFTLKTPDYQERTIANFNSALLAWANEDPERAERVDEDMRYDDFSVALTAEELSFIKETVFLSGMENGKKIQSIYTGAKPEDPYYGEELPEKETLPEEKAFLKKKTPPEKEADGRLDIARCSLYYEFSYTISDTETVTVGERDRQIREMIQAVRIFWDDMDVEHALKMSENEIMKQLEDLAASYSTEHIAITIHKRRIHWERIDERTFS